MVLSFVGFFIGLILLIIFTMRGVNIIIAALVCSVVLALSSSLSLEKALTESYMSGFVGYFSSWFLVYMLGAIFGKVMEETKAADAIAEWVKVKVGAKRAVFAVVAACALMTYGGVSIAIVGFSVYPIAVSLFRVANLPHRFIPGAIVFGSISFTMTSPGSPEVQNLIPMEFFHTQPTGGGLIGYLIGILIMVAGGYWLKFMVTNAVKNGEVFKLPGSASSGTALEETAAAMETAKDKENLPNILSAILPLIIVVAALNIAAKFMSPTGAALIGLFLGVVSALALMGKYSTSKYGQIFSKGTENAIIATVNICAVVGFGSVAKEAPAFKAIVDALVNMPGMEYAGLAAAVTIIAGVTGSASGGLGIALPILAPLYQAQGLDPGAMHRISSIASGGLDSLPHNGYVVTTIRAVCNETHQRAYKPIFILSVVLPMIALIIAVILYTIFY
ncbi:GntP family permease [Neobacillus mesonae]|uniref:GntP family permease n=1 Tax=Neobacillus mesonae TaxID=1193713 RepID=UPI002041F007|nr:GntP family permease [Neobacillus mesonae]MCM3568978.1 GntP family permease [Neobacillus mesonae]